MGRARLPPLALAAVFASALPACGAERDGTDGASVPQTVTAPAPAGAKAQPAAAAKRLRDWPMFGLTAGRPSATNASTGIAAGDLARLRRRQVQVPGTVDSTPIVLGATAFATT